MKKKRPMNAWQLLCKATRGLCQVSYKHAMKHEPTPEFPGVDIDAIHKLGKVKARG